MLAGLAALPFAMSRANAQVVAIFGSQTVTADTNGDITIDVGQISGTALLKVHDPTAGSSTPPTANLRTLTIVGTAASGGKLQVLVANPQTTVIPVGVDISNFIEPGVANWSAPNSNAIVFSDSGLRDVSEIAAAVTGDIAGNIQIGNVVKLQALGVTNPNTGIVAGGTIDSNITATAPDPFNGSDAPPGLGNSAINIIEAFRQIKGSIQATSGSRLSGGLIQQSASISRVRVFGEFSQGNSLGLDADILAPNGSISGIFSTGPIGTSRRVTISAGETIAQIRTADVGSNAINSSTPARAINADISAGTGYNTTTNIAAQQRYGKLQLLESSGDITGDIKMQSLGSHAANYDNINRGGILVWGRIVGNITIAENSYSADIIASSIVGHVKVGWCLFGSIVAYGTDTAVDPSAGTITSVSVGRATVVSPETENNYPRGFVGGKNPPIDLTPTGSNPWFDRTGASLHGGDSVDSTIFAKAIPAIDLYQMTLEEKNSAQAPFRPRVEVRDGGELTVGEIKAGIIWSGKLVFNDSTIVTSPSDYYMKAKKVIFGCVSPVSDVWINGISEASLEVSVENDLRGELRVSSLRQGDYVHVGLGLASPSPLPAGPNARFVGCGCWTTLTGVIPTCDGNEPFGSGCRYPCYSFTEEQTPRGIVGTENDVRIANPPLLDIREDAGLVGQVVLNASNNVPIETGSTYPFGAWTGNVIVGSGNPSTQIVLSPNSSNAMAKAPFYEMSSMPLGGGAVGVVPFRIYEADCVPPLNVRSSSPPSLPTNTNTVTTSSFVGPTGTACNSPVPVKIRFYGPVTLNPETDLLIKGTTDVGTAVCGATFTDMVQSLFLIRPPGTTPGIEARTIGLSRSSSCPTVNPGKYRIGESEAFPDVSAVLCVPGMGDHPIPAEFNDVCNDSPEGRAYYFRVVAEANNCTDPGNFNGVDGITVADIFDFLNAWFAGSPSADLDGIGGVAVPDIFFFLNEWFDGCS